MTRKTAARSTTTATLAAAPSTLRRDLGQQASRFALLTAIGLAAAGAGSLAAPGEALADCVNNGITLQCTGTTTTTNTAGSRSHINPTTPPLSSGVFVETGAVVDGHGLAFSNPQSGGINATNNGAIRVNAGNAATEGGSRAALSLNSSAGITYAGSGSITHDGGNPVTGMNIGPALEALSTGGGDIEINAGGALRGQSGIVAITDGRVNIVASGGVTGTWDGAISATGTAGVSVDVTGDSSGEYTGIALLGGSNAGGDLSLTSTGNVTAKGGSAISLHNNGSGSSTVNLIGSASVDQGEGLRVSNLSVNGNGIDIDVNGSVSANSGAGINAYATGANRATNINVTGNVSGGYVGVTAQHLFGNDDINITVGGSVTGQAGVFAEQQLREGDISITVGGPITSSVGDGVYTYARGNSTVSVGSITAAASGVSMTHGSGGIAANLTLTGAGDITAMNGRGVQMTNDAVGGIVLDRTGAIASINGDGVNLQQASGSITARVGSVTVSGRDLIGTADERTANGITTSGTGSVNLIVEGDVTAAGSGIVGTGTGSSTIVTNGVIIAADGDGVSETRTGGVDYSVNNDVTGSARGVHIDAGSSGSGDVRLVGAGAITGQNGNGVEITNRGSGATTVNLTGPVTSTNGTGLTLNARASAGAISVATGAVTANNGNGVSVSSNTDEAGVSISTNGAVQARDYGIVVGAQMTGTANLTVTADAAVTGQVGIQAQRAGSGTGELAVVARGPVRGTDGAGIIAIGRQVSIEAGDVRGSTHGIVANNSTALGGSSGNGGIRLTGSGNIVAENGNAIDFTNMGTGPVLIDRGGIIDAANGDGVRVRDTAIGGDITIEVGQVTARGVNAGDAAPADGIDIVSDSLVADIDVTVREGVSADGLGLNVDLNDEFATGDISVTTLGSVTAAYGVVVRNSGAGDINLIASGDVTATSGEGIYAEGRGDISLRADGVVSGSETGLYIEAGSTGAGGDIRVTGSGSLVGGAGSALFIDNRGRGSVLVDVTGASRSTSGDGFLVRDVNNESGDILIGTGAITAENGHGVYVSSGSDRAELQIVTRGDVLAGARGVYANLSNSTSERAIMVQALGAVRGDIGIEARHQGLGSVFIEADGPVTGRQAEGIVAVGRGAVGVGNNGVVTGATHGATIIGGRAGEASDIFIAGTGGFVGQAGNGLQIQNNGAGGVIVDIQGATSGTQHGIIIRDSGQGGDVSVTTGAVTAGDAGIVLYTQSQSASLTAISTGDITAGTGAGIRAVIDQTNASRAISITSGGATSGNVGVSALNNGTGRIDVVAEGSVRGTGQTGISLIGRDAVTLIANGPVSSAETGARIVGGRTGVEADLTVRGTGSFTGENGSGLVVDNGGEGDVIVDIAGSISGMGGNGVGIVDNANGGNITVTTGTVTSSLTSIHANSLSEGGTVLITANGDVTNTGSELGESGILATLGQNATGNIGIVARGAVSGSGAGIAAINAGTGVTVVRADGAVTGRRAQGLLAAGRGGVSVEANGSVIGETVGALLEGGRAGVAADISVTGAGGFVGRTGNGLEIQNNGTGAVTVDIAGASSGATNGIIVRDLGAGGDVSVETGAVSAGLNGINLYTRSAAANLTAIANGDVTATGGAGIAATIENTSSDRFISIAARGTVSGFTGLAASHTGTGAISIAAEGPVTATGDFGLFAQGRGAVDVVANGAVSGVAHGALVVGGRAGVASDVSVRGTGGFTGTAGSGLTVFNQGDGATTVDISGASAATTDGVTVTANQQSAGDVTVTAGAVTAGRHGVYVESESVGSDVRVTTNGAVSAGANGIGIVARLDSEDAAGDILVEANGSITGGRGIVAQHLGSGDISIEANARIDAASGSGITATGAGGISVAVSNRVSGVNGLTIAGGHAVDGGNLVVTGLGGFNGTDGNAVQIVNTGSGAVRYDVAGPVTAVNGNGIAIVDTAAGGDIDVITGDVSADSANGSAVAINSSSTRGSIDVTAYGALRGGLAGVQAVLESASALGSITINTVSTVDGRFGISASNLGTGAILIGASDRVTSTFGAAISARGNEIAINAAGPVVGANGGVIASSGLNGAGPLTITTGAVSGGAGQAIHAVNAGAGAVTVAASGPVTGAGGIAVGGAAATGDIRITTAAVTASDDELSAIEAFSASTTGDVSIAATGALTATGLAVRTILNSTAATGDIDVALSGPVTAAAGVAALNDGTGRTTITATGPVNASVGNGLTAVNRIGDIAITAGDVSGGAQTGNAIVAERNGAVPGAGDIAISAANLDAGRGVLARNTGGDTRVTTTGNVFGRAYEGIAVVHANGAGDITVDARNVSGRTVGISVANNGAGDTDIAVRGLVTGSDAAIVIQSSGDQAVRLTNTGDIRNFGNRSSDLALQLSGGAVSMANTGNILGRLVLLGDTNTVDNRGRWNSMGGVSAFQGSNDRLTNGVGGEIIGGGESSMRETTVWQGLETFENRGLLTLRDGGVGDVISTTANSVLATGSTLRVDIGGQNLADLFRTTGTLNIQTGATLDVNFNQPLALGRYIVAEAAQGLTGEFVFEDRLVSAFIGLQDGYTSTTAYVELSQMRAFEEAGDTPNRRETGRGVDSLESGNPLFDAIVVMPDDGAARDAFDQLSGEIHPAMRRAMVDDSRLPRDAVLQRLETEAGNGRYWAESYYGRGRVSADGNATRAGRESTGMLFGMDGAAAPGVTVGVAAGWLDSEIELDARNSTGTATNVHGMAYAGYRMGRWSLRGGAAYARTSVDTERSVAFAGVTDKLTSGYDGSVMQAFLETGYRLPTHGGYVEPFLNLTTIHANTDAFREAGGAARLEGEGARDDLYMSTLGFRVQTERPGAFSARGMLGLRHMNGDLAQAGQHRFPGGGVFTVLTSSHSDLAAVATFEADWQLTPWLAFGATFDGAKGEDGGDHTVSGRFRIAF